MVLDSACASDCEPKADAAGLEVAVVVLPKARRIGFTSRYFNDSIISELDGFDTELRAIPIVRASAMVAPGRTIAVKHLR